MITILLIDDSLDDLELVKREIESSNEDIHVSTCNAPSLALGKIESETFDCILCDFRMPKIDGLQILRHLRGRDNFTPFILLTGQGNERVAVEALRAGANDYFSKDGELEDLSELIKSIRKAAEIKRAQLERREADDVKELKQIGANLMTIFSNSLQAFLLISKECRIKAFNKLAHLNIKISTGRDLQEGEDIFLYFQEEDHIDARRSLEAAFDGRSAVIERRLSRIDRGDMWAQFYFNPVFSTDQRIIGACLNIADITERKLQEEELQRSHTKLVNLSAHLQTMIEKERATIAREVHDELGQSLTALKMDLHWLSKKCTHEDPHITAKLGSMMGILDSSISAIKRITSELRPVLLDDLGLTAAIEWHIENFEKRTGIACTVELDISDDLLERDLATTLFRIIQEALTNVARHAQATSVTVRVGIVDELISATIVDDGKGISESEISDPVSFGLLGMQERAVYHGGSLEISGRPDSGTTVVVRIPLRHERRG